MPRTQTIKCLNFAKEIVNDIPENSWNMDDGNFYNFRSLFIHVCICLEKYFTIENDDKFNWGKFGGTEWWLNKYPIKSKMQVIQDIDSIIERINQNFDKINISRVIYANQHTMYHLGQLSILSKNVGGKIPKWDSIFN